jgi:hypothetical protein
MIWAQAAQGSSPNPMKAEIRLGLALSPVAGVFFDSEQNHSACPIDRRFNTVPTFFRRELSSVADFSPFSGMSMPGQLVACHFNPTAMSRSDWHPVVRSPEQQLRLHPAMKELGWAGVIDELNDAARLKDRSVPEPILITTNGAILAGFGHWRLGMLEGRHEVNCLECPLSEDEALQFILTHHQTRCGWNDFVRIRLALTLEPILQQTALDNMRAGASSRVRQICRWLTASMFARRSPSVRAQAPAM